MSRLSDILQNDVVVLWSGGPDSTGLIALLLKKYPCKVYPLFINREQSNLEFEKKSVEHYGNEFKNASNFNDHFEVKIINPPNEFRSFDDSAKYAIRNSDLINQGVRYAIHKGIKTVLLATFENENQFGDGSRTYLEAKTAEVQIGTEFNDFTVCSPFHYSDFPNAKSELIKKCRDEGVSLTKTRSCYKTEEKHCGDCKSCTNRYSSFMEALGKDETEYSKKPTVSYESRSEKIGI